MPEVVYMIAEERFDGDLSALSQTAHVWVWLTEHNSELYKAALSRDDRDNSPRYGLSGYHGDESLESVYRYLGTVDEHHGEYASDPPWTEIRIIGADAGQLDPVRVQQELDVGEISITDEHGMAIIRRAS